ncbi:hypothetical protein [Nitrosomonas sp. Nm34]|uniref:hypothetical protein n=1 Tax=Nitrosomonas sp. Nm34 TaxID=1881055 RepID=UPI0008E2D38E|nr:hypothetical protein [Nitrosomonas sp. Nm34]SFI22617.1 hypothetical protein SAMN05428978_1002155 [Nitrosomonas sp. Nm34]
MLIIVGDNFSKSLKRVFIFYVIYEEITDIRLSIGNEVVTDGASFFAGNVKDKPTESCIPAPESDSVIFELYND